MIPPTTKSRQGHSWNVGGRLCQVVILVLVSITVIVFAATCFASISQTSDARLEWQIRASVDSATRFQTTTATLEQFTDTNGPTEAQVHQDEVSAQSGDPNGQFHLALYYATGHGEILNPSAAADWCKKAALQGFAPAENYLGLILENGFGTPTNAVEAVQWYHRASDQGELDGMFNLAISLTYAQGVQQNYQEAFNLYEKSAQKGHLPSMNNLGTAYLQGHGVSANLDEAIHWLKEAATHGVLIAQWNLASVYGSGAWGITNYPEALVWLRMGAENGNPLCQNFYGWALRKGLGTTPDLENGWYWTAKAASNGV